MANGLLRISARSSRLAIAAIKNCGKIVRIKDPIDPETGQPRQDKNNPDTSLQRRPIIGLTMLADITRVGPGLWSAVSYDPRNGEEHDITVRLIAGGTKMELRGAAPGSGRER
jgi:uncharacterized protein (DUF2147 family)